MNKDETESFSHNDNIKRAGSRIGGNELYNNRERNDSEIDMMTDASQQIQYYQNHDDRGASLPAMTGTNPGSAANGTLNSYKINYDPEPQIVRKQVTHPVVYKQEVAVRYLKPPTPPPPGPLIIKEVRANQQPPAPPVIIRQRPPRPATPPPLVIRERPPQPPHALGPKVITRNLPAVPPPPRRVIIERLPPLPPKPRSIIVERWLPYKQLKRRVVYQRAPQLEPPQPQKNLIIQWEGAQVKVQKEFRNLGIARADPNMYVQQYGPNLKHSSALPDFAKSLAMPNEANGEQFDQNNAMMNQPDMIPPSFADQAFSSLPADLTNHNLMDGDCFSNSINMVTGADLDNGRTLDFQNFNDFHYDELRGSIPIDNISMMNYDRSMMDGNSCLPTTNNSYSSYQQYVGNCSNSNAGCFDMSTTSGYSHQNFLHHDFEDMNDTSSSSVNHHMLNVGNNGTPQIGTLMAAE